METNAARKTLAAIALEKGTGSALKNLQTVLNTLHMIAEQATIERTVFDSQFQRLRAYITTLEKHECVRLTYSSDCIRSVLRITVLRNELPTKAVEMMRPSPRHQPPAPVKPTQAIPNKPAEQIVNGPKPSCLFFLDLPNFCNFKIDLVSRKRVHYIGLFRANWSKLLDIVCNITSFAPEHIHAYAYLKARENMDEEGKKKFRTVSNALIGGGFNPVIRGKKDVDLIMVADMMYHVMRNLMQRRDTTLVLGSSDSDYAWAIYRLQEVAKEFGVKLTVFTFSWKNKLSNNGGDLAAVVGEKRMFYVENYLRQIDPVGARYFSEEKINRDASRTPLKKVLA